LWAGIVTKEGYTPRKLPRRRKIVGQPNTLQMTWNLITQIVARLETVVPPARTRGKKRTKGVREVETRVVNPGNKCLPRSTRECWDSRTVEVGVLAPLDSSSLVRG
jgi:hypothetical protein